MSDKDNKGGNGDKTKRLDDDHFRRIAERAKNRSSDDDKTQIVTEAGATSRPDDRVSDDRKTRVFRGTEEATANYSKPDSILNAMEDPPTGWLIAVSGPGQGHVLQLGMGVNGIGRDGNDVRIPIRFNDDQISRGVSLVVVYDEKNRKFFVDKGVGKTLAYIENSPVLEPSEISSGIDISIGQTVFKFIALCGETFNWNDQLD